MINIPTFNHKNTLEENLCIFIYIEFFVNKKKVLTLTDYRKYELRDTHIKIYNESILDIKNKSSIGEWITTNKDFVNEFSKGFGTLYKPKVSLWRDRNKTSYYKEKLQASFEFENYLEAFFKEKNYPCKTIFYKDGEVITFAGNSVA
jgi:hypothetical protein